MLISIVFAASSPLVVGEVSIGFVFIRPPDPCYCTVVFIMAPLCIALSIVEPVSPLGTLWESLGCGAERLSAFGLCVLALELAVTLLNGRIRVAFRDIVRSLEQCGSE